MKGWSLNSAAEVGRAVVEAKANRTDPRVLTAINPGNPTGALFAYNTA
jgi:aspartate/methionine/tyrosine aminotransferase